MKDVNKKVIILMQIRYSMLLIQKEILELGKQTKQEEFNVMEVKKINNILDILDYIEINIKNGVITDKFINSNKSLEQLGKELQLYFFYINNKDTFNKASLIAYKISEFKSKNIDFNRYLNIFNDYISSRLSNIIISEKLIDNILNDIDEKNINIMFKFANDKNKKTLFSEMITRYNLEKKDKLIKLILNLSKKYPCLGKIKPLNHQIYSLLNYSDTKYLEFLKNCGILNFEEYNAKTLLLHSIDVRRYDMCLFLYENCFIENDFEILKILFEATPFDDKQKLCDLILLIIKSDKFKKVDVKMLKYIKNIIMEKEFGMQQEKKYDFFEDHKDKFISESHKLLDFLLDNDYIPEELEMYSEDLFVQADEILGNIEFGLIERNNSNIKSLKIVIDKRKFVEKLMSELIDKTPEKLHPYLMRCYTEIINIDETIQQQKLIKTLSNILDKNNKIIEK